MLKKPSPGLRDLADAVIAGKFEVVNLEVATFWDAIQQEAAGKG